MQGIQAPITRMMPSQAKQSDELWPKKLPIEKNVVESSSSLPSIGLALRMPTPTPTPFMPIATRPMQAADSSITPRASTQDAVLTIQSGAQYLKKLASENKEMRTPKPYTGRVWFAHHFCPLPQLMSNLQKRGRKKIDKTSFFCHNCGTRVTTEWRKGPSGTRLFSLWVFYPDTRDVHRQEYAV